MKHLEKKSNISSLQKIPQNNHHARTGNRGLEKILQNNTVHNNIMPMEHQSHLFFCSLAPLPKIIGFITVIIIRVHYFVGMSKSL